jgi:hypothetical protein
MATINNADRKYLIEVNTVGDGNIDIVRDGAGCYTSMTVTWAEALALSVFLAKAANHEKKNSLIEQCYEVTNSVSIAKGDKPHLENTDILKEILSLLEKK